MSEVETCDASMRFQQQVIGRKIAVLALTQTNCRWSNYTC